jgi:hypothetical protein
VSVAALRLAVIMMDSVRAQAEALLQRVGSGWRELEAGEESKTVKQEKPELEFLTQTQTSVSSNNVNQSQW